MKPLTPTLEAAQQSLHRTPVVGAAVHDLERGVSRLRWERCYTGSEPESHHGLAFDGNGNMHRLRVEGTTLRRQRVLNPTPSSTFSSWSIVTTGCAGPCAIAAHGSHVWIFWRTTGNVIAYRYSTDYGSSWTTAATMVSYSNVISMAAAWWIGLGAVNVVCFTLRTNEISAIVWDSTTNTLVAHSIVTFTAPHTHSISQTYGIGATWDPGLNRIAVIFAGRRYLAGAYTYSIFTTQLSPWHAFAGVSELVIIPRDPDHHDLLRYEYPDCHLPLSPASYESIRLTAVEKFTGIDPYDRPVTSHLVGGTYWTDGTIVEPRPLVDVGSQYGLRLGTNAGYWWMTRPDGVWYAPRVPATPVDLTPDIMSFQLNANAVASAELAAGPGTLVIELDNSRGQYADLGVGPLAPLTFRGEVELRLGYQTADPLLTPETIEVGRYWIDSWQYNSMSLRTPGRLGLQTLTLYCLDAWGLASRWTPRYLMRWNHNGTPSNVWQILYRILARIGIRLVTGPPRSWGMLNYYPDFAMVPGQRGDALIRRALALVPDQLVFDGNEAWVKDPLPAEATCYEYGPDDHQIMAGRYGERVSASRTRAIGRDPADEQIIADAIDWSLQQLFDLLALTYDPRLTTHALADARAQAMLRSATLGGRWSDILVPPNVAQELLDVVEVTDSRAGVQDERFRIRSILTEFDRRRARFDQTLTLGAP